MKLKELFSKTKKIKCESYVEICVCTDPTVTNPSLVSANVINLLISHGYSITASDLEDIGYVSLDPFTGDKIRRNGRYAKIKLIKHYISGVKITSDTVDKKFDEAAYIKDVDKSAQDDLEKICAVAKTNIVECSDDRKKAYCVFDSKVHSNLIK